ncbi:MAG: DUF58 domain-containing protein [Bdellovibrionales bacterium]|nr:DUF58 domain-containing protein [Bdellovibrionales bacterium]
MEPSSVRSDRTEFVLTRQEYARNLDKLSAEIESFLGGKGIHRPPSKENFPQALDTFSRVIGEVSHGLERALKSRLVFYMSSEQRSAVDALHGDMSSLQQFLRGFSQDDVPSMRSEAILQLGSQCLKSLQSVPAEWITRPIKELNQIASAKGESPEFTANDLLLALKRDTLGISTNPSALGDVRGKSVRSWDDSRFFSGDRALMTAAQVGLQQKREQFFGKIVTRNPARVYESLPIDGLVVAEPGPEGMLVSSLERFLLRDCGGEGIQVQTFPHVDEIPPLERDDVYIAVDRRDLMSYDGRVCLPIPRGYRVVAISLFDGEGEKISTNPQVLSALQLTASVSQEHQFEKVEYVLTPVEDRPCYATLIERLPQLLPSLPHHPEENLRRALQEAAKIEDLSARQNAIANIEEASGLIYQQSDELRALYQLAGPNFLALAEGGVGTCWELTHRLVHRMNALEAGPALMALAPSFTSDCKSFRRPGHCAALLLGQGGEMRVFDPTYWADTERALFLTLMTNEEWEFAERHLSSVSEQEVVEFVYSLRMRYEDSYQHALGPNSADPHVGHGFQHDFKARNLEEVLAGTPAGKLLYGFGAKDEAVLIEVNKDREASQVVKHLAAQCLAVLAKHPGFPRTPKILNYLANPYPGARAEEEPYVPVSLLRSCFRDAHFEDATRSGLSWLLDRTIQCAFLKEHPFDPIEFYPAISTLLDRGVSIALEHDIDPIGLASLGQFIGYMRNVASGTAPASESIQFECAMDLKAYLEAAGHSPKSLFLAVVKGEIDWQVEQVEYVFSCFAAIGEYEEEIRSSGEGFEFTENTKQQLRGQLCSEICKAIRRNTSTELNRIDWDLFSHRVEISEDFVEQVEEEISDVIDARQNPAMLSNPLTYLLTMEMSSSAPGEMLEWQAILRKLQQGRVVRDEFLQSISQPSREPREIWKLCSSMSAHDFSAYLSTGRSRLGSRLVLCEHYFEFEEDRTSELMNLHSVPLVVLRDLVRSGVGRSVERLAALEREFGALVSTPNDGELEEVFTRWREGFSEDYEKFVELLRNGAGDGNSVSGAVHREFLSRLKRPHDQSLCELALASRYFEEAEVTAFRDSFKLAADEIAKRFDAGDVGATEEAINKFRDKFFDQRFLPLDSREHLLLYALSTPQPKTFSRWKEWAGLSKDERLNTRELLIRLMGITDENLEDAAVTRVWRLFQESSDERRVEQLEAAGTRFSRAIHERARRAPSASTGDFESFTDYLPGSHSIRQIDWRASAKHDALLVQNKRDGDSVQFEVVLDLSATIAGSDIGASVLRPVFHELRELSLSHKEPSLVLSVAGIRLKEFSAPELKTALFSKSPGGESAPIAFATFWEEFGNFIKGYARLTEILPTGRLHAQFCAHGARDGGSNRVVSFYCDSTDKQFIESALFTAEKRQGIKGYVTAI